MKIGNMGNNRGKPIFLGIFLTWVVAISISLIGSDVYASAIQHHEPATIFAASCSTCHGAKGLGGVTFVKDGVGDNRTAPQIAGKPARYIKAKVRSGSKNAAMPAFGKEEITDAELNALANWLEAATSSGVDAPSTSASIAVRLDILDADPWFTDHNADVNSDNRRLKLTSSSQYLKVVNTGRTWHTFTNSKKLRDSGFIGYAGNYRETPGDLDNGRSDSEVGVSAWESANDQVAKIGYYYATQATSATDEESGLAYGCVKYWCKMHPYMAVEVCDANAGTPKVLTRASKNPIGNPTAPGASDAEVWVTVQSQEEAPELHTTDVGFYSPNSTGDPFGVGNDMDGVYQVIHAGNGDGPAWTTVDYIANVGNNPHNSWPGKDGATPPNNVVVSANWHDNTVDVMDVATKTLIMEKRSGTTNAHVMTTPGNVEDFYVTHMGGRAVQRLDVDQLELGFDPNISPGAMSGDGMTLGATGPHGLWMCDEQTDGSDPGTDTDNYILTADTFAGGATIYAADYKTSKSTGSGGSAPLAPSIMSGYSGGCERGFTNNALTTDVSIYDIDISPSLGIKRLPQSQADNGAGVPDYNQAGNIQLTDTSSEDSTSTYGASGCTPVGVGKGHKCTDPVRWAALPIQTPVSPDDASPYAPSGGHSRYMVTANKASFNVSVTKLDAGTGLPTGLYTFPGGLGAHGVTYGPKENCVDSTGKCYYAYVTNTFEGGRNDGATAGYISVYDLEKIDNGGMGLPGSAFTINATSGTTTGTGTAITSLSPTATGTVTGTGNYVCLDLTGGDGNLMDTNSEMVYVEGWTAGVVINNLMANAPNLGVVKSPSAACGAGKVEIDLSLSNTVPDVIEVAALAGLVSTADRGVVNTTTCMVSGSPNGTFDIIEVLGNGCLLLGGNAGDTDGDGLGPDLLAPITAVCPDCRSGVHVGDVSLKDAPNLVKVEVNAASGGDDDGVCDAGETCASADTTEYTYYRSDVWVDDVNPFVVTVAGGPLNGAIVGIGGTQNSKVSDVDLDLQINTGAQGIVGFSPTISSAPWP